MTSLAMLKDNKAQVELLLEKIKKNMNKWDTLEKSDQTKISNIVYADFKSINTLLDVMKVDLKNLKNEQTEKAFKDHITQLKHDYKKLNEEFVQKQNQKSDLDGLLLDEIQIKEKTNDQMNILELKNKGDRLVDEQGQAVNRIDKKVNEQLNMAQAIKQDLARQNDKLDDAQKNLKEIDYSLARARKQLSTMFKMYATDKIIMCLIVIIVLVIIAIIIVAAVGGDKNNTFNVPHDIWVAGNKTTTTSTTTTRILFLNGQD